MNRGFQIGDQVVCRQSGIVGVAIRFYKATACAEQTMVRTRDGRKYHAPTSEWVRITEEETKANNPQKMINPLGEYALKFAENHGITIAEAYEHQMVRARREFFYQTGM